MVENIFSRRNSIFPSRKASPQSAERLTAPSAEEAKKALTRTASTKKSDGKSHRIFDVLLTHAACPRRLCQPPWTQPSLSETRPTHRRNQRRRKAHLKRQLLFGSGGLGEGNIRELSNGESALFYFRQRVAEDALYLLDEPENSLSADKQLELADYLAESARYAGCQMVIATHSPFLLALPGAKIYDFDKHPVEVRPWTALHAVRVYAEFFKQHEREFTEADGYGY